MDEKSINNRKTREKEIVRLMITIFCKGKGHNGQEVCRDCTQLIGYSEKKIDSCPHITTKTFCSSCSTHCFAPEERKTIKEVMRYSGPRMLSHHPLVLLKHLIQG